MITRLDELDELGRRYVLTVDLPVDFALNQPLAHFALAALDVLDPESPDHALDVVSVIESVLDAPRQILFAQQHAARGEAIAEMKADGLEYDERMALLEEITWPQPLAELLGATYEIYRQRHPWLPEDALGPKSVVREMYEQGMSFTDFVRRYQLARSEGLVLRYLTDAYRTLRQTVPGGAPHRRAGGPRRSGWGRRCARPTPRCSTSGRRSPTRRGGAACRGARRVRPAHLGPTDLTPGAGVRGHGPQRDVARASSWSPATTSTA